MFHKVSKLNSWWVEDDDSVHQKVNPCPRIWQDKIYEMGKLFNYQSLVDREDREGKCLIY
jgi:hypothetical protein